MILLYFLHNCAAYGCMTFFSDTLNGRKFDGLEKGVLFAIPYILTAVIMVITSRSSDRTGERHWHVATVYIMSGVCLILSVLLSDHFWLSYVLLCFAIPGPFAALAPFWSIPAEVLPRSVIGLVIGIVNAFGNVGGFAGPYFVGWLKKEYETTPAPFGLSSTGVSFGLLGVGMLICAGLVFLLPKGKHKMQAPGSPGLPNRA
jgi:MFS family permease